MVEKIIVTKGVSMKFIACFAGIALLSGCGGSSTAYLGSVEARPDAAGVVAGVAADDYDIVRDEAGNGYVVGFTIGADPDNFSSGNIAGATANYAFSGILPDVDVGTFPATGRASMTGQYDAVLVEGYATTSNPNAWSVTEDSGPITLQVNFGAGEISGRSFDGHLTISNDTSYGDDEDLTHFGDGFRGEVLYRGRGTEFYTGELGADGAVAVFNGQDDSSFWAGGFVASTR